MPFAPRSGVVARAGPCGPDHAPGREGGDRRGDLEDDAVRDYRAPQLSEQRPYEPDRVPGQGWLLFAALMLGWAGAFNILDGIIALSRSKFFVEEAVYVFSDLNTWGWIVILLGAAQLLAAFLLFSGSQLARWFGIAAAGANAIGQLMFAPAYPFWALSLFAVDVLIIYALAAYAGPQLRRAE
jgi:hypothetical protein